MQSGSIPSADEIRARASHQLFGKPLVTNVLRAVIAETIVDRALGDRWRWCSEDYAAWDFERDDGLRLELKQSASRQTWHRLGDAESRVIFDVAERKGRFDGTVWHQERRRWADLYVFAHHHVSDISADHADPAQWYFYIVATAALPKQDQVSLGRLQKLAKPRTYLELASAVEDCSASLHGA